MANKVHIVAHNRNDGWDSKVAGEEKSLKHSSNQAECIKYTRAISQNQHSELKNQGRDGKFRASDSHGNNPSHQEVKATVGNAPKKQLQLKKQSHCNCKCKTSVHIMFFILVHTFVVFSICITCTFTHPSQVIQIPFDCELDTIFKQSSRTPTKLFISL